MQEGLVFQEYRNPITTGWKGWIENREGNVIAFVKLDGRIIEWKENVS